MLFFEIPKCAWPTIKTLIIYFVCTFNDYVFAFMTPTVHSSILDNSISGKLAMIRVISGDVDVVRSADVLDNMRYKRSCFKKLVK